MSQYQTIFLRTQDASIQEASSTWSWNLAKALTFPQGTRVQVGLSHCWVFNLFQTITSSNNALVTSLGTITLPSGAYLGSDLATELTTLMTSLSISVSFSDGTLGFSFTGAAFSIYGSASGSTCLQLLGFSDATHTLSSSTSYLTSDLLADLSAPTAIAVDTNFLVFNVDSATGGAAGTTRLCYVPVSGAYGDMISYNPAVPIYADSYDHFIPSIRVAFSDASTGAQLDLQSTYPIIVLTIIVTPPDQLPASLSAITAQYFDNQGVNSTLQQNVATNSIL